MDGEEKGATCSSSFVAHSLPVALAIYLSILQVCIRCISYVCNVFVNKTSETTQREANGTTQVRRANEQNQTYTCTIDRALGHFYTLCFAQGLP